MAGVNVSTDVIKPVEHIDDTTVAEKIHSKASVFRKLKKRNRGSRKSSPSNVRKPQLSHQGVIFREVPAPVSPQSNERRAEDVAKCISKKKKRQQKLVVQEDSSEEEIVPETPEPIVSQSRGGERIQAFGERTPCVIRSRSQEREGM
ncbi:unnamed protein product [Lactuca virosa]|uniref:Uncharacterized protein n=1 Tax=Lactuca virosa TaxID=75947 RepID=A0AAU9NBC5_9ASTR|nr:unnamed protein product [Lactuca virosa]